MGLGSNHGDLITGHVHTLCKQLFLLHKKELEEVNVNIEKTTYEGKCLKGRLVFLEIETWERKKTVHDTIKQRGGMETK